MAKEDTEKLKPLNRPQQVFVTEYLKCFNATEAYTRAYPKAKRSSARACAADLLKNERIKKEIEQHQYTAREYKKPKNCKSTYVYLIQAENGLVKIGKTSDVVTRLKTLDVGSPLRLELVCSIYTQFADELEDKLHGIYSDKRVKGEWFNLSDADIKEIIESYGT